MKNIPKVIYIVVILISFLASSYAENITKTNKLILGRVENVQITKNHIFLKAKLDTGAIISSLHVENMQIYDKHGAPWVKFSVVHNNNDVSHFNKPIVRFIRIKKRSEEIKGDNKTHSRRPIVYLMLCIGHEKKQIEVNLTNRGRFLYPLLLGRNAIVQFNAIVDPSDSFTEKPVCPR